MSETNNTLKTKKKQYKHLKKEDRIVELHLVSHHF